MCSTFFTRPQEPRPTNPSTFRSSRDVTSHHGLVVSCTAPCSPPTSHSHWSVPGSAKQQTKQQLWGVTEAMRNEPFPLPCAVPATRSTHSYSFHPSRMHRQLPERKHQTIGQKAVPRADAARARGQQIGGARGRQDGCLAAGQLRLQQAQAVLVDDEAALHKCARVRPAPPITSEPAPMCSPSRLGDMHARPHSGALRARTKRTGQRLWVWGWWARCSPTPWGAPWRRVWEACSWCLRSLCPSRSEHSSSNKRRGSEQAARHIRQRLIFVCSTSVAIAAAARGARVRAMQVMHVSAIHFSWRGWRASKRLQSTEDSLPA